MKYLKEPLSRLANRQDKTRGAFFEGRFKSVGILDEESLLATCAYIDLNPVAAGIAKVPEWLEKLKAGRLLGRFFAASRARLREVAAILRVRHLANLGGCPAR